MRSGLVPDSSMTNNALFYFRGYNIGQRLIEDFLARSNIGRCTEFRETAEVISKVCVGERSAYKLRIHLEGFVNFRLDSRFS